MRGIVGQRLEGAPCIGGVRGGAPCTGKSQEGVGVEDSVSGTIATDNIPNHSVYCRISAYARCKVHHISGIIGPVIVGSWCHESGRCDAC